MSIDWTERLNQKIASVGLQSIQIKENKQLIDFVLLLLRWNARTNLTAVRDADGMLDRHILESIACAQSLPANISSLLDYGSGAGFPGIPLAICRPEIMVTLAESQNKKAAFLQEAVRTTGVSARIHVGRAETLSMRFDCVTLRAVDRMEQAVLSAARLVAAGGWLAPLTTRSELAVLQPIAGAGFFWSEPVPLPGSDQRILALAQQHELPH
jgi:16S rRNA (guanine527-N7)-methyltransferase